MNLSLKPILSGAGLAFKLAVVWVAFSFLIFPPPGHGQAASDNGTRSIQRGSESEKALKMEERSYQKREERLNAKPLDWNSTIGKPKPRRLTPAERSALRKARPERTEGGAPNPNADEEARKHYPDDWK